jgi:hypothetical protein
VKPELQTGETGRYLCPNRKKKGWELLCDLIHNLLIQRLNFGWKETHDIATFVDNIFAKIPGG